MGQAPDPEIPEYTFLKHSIQVWPPALGDSPSSSSSSIRSSPSAPPVGVNTWPFSFAIPRYFTLRGQDHPLPPTYSDKAYMTYVIHVVLKRDLLYSDIKFVHLAFASLFVPNTDSQSFSISTRFRYIPRRRPRNPSELFIRALVDNTPVPGKHSEYKFLSKAVVSSLLNVGTSRTSSRPTRMDRI